MAGAVEPHLVGQPVAVDVDQLDLDRGEVGAEPTAERRRIHRLEPADGAAGGGVAERLGIAEAQREREIGAPLQRHRDAALLLAGAHAQRGDVGQLRILAVEGDVDDAVTVHVAHVHRLRGGAGAQVEREVGGPERDPHARGDCAARAGAYRLPAANIAWAELAGSPVGLSAPRRPAPKLWLVTKAVPSALTNAGTGARPGLLPVGAPLGARHHRREEAAALREGIERVAQLALAVEELVVGGDPVQAQLHRRVEDGRVEGLARGPVPGPVAPAVEPAAEGRDRAVEGDVLRNREGKAVDGDGHRPAAEAGIRLRVQLEVDLGRRSGPGRWWRRSRRRGA